MANDAWLQLCDDIDDGSFDEGLNEIAKAIQSRRDVVIRRNARRLQRSLKVGDKVKLTNGITPRYLNNMVGYIEAIRDGAAIVKLTKMPVRSGAGRPSAAEKEMKDKFTIPFEYLVKIDDNDTQELGEVDMAGEIGDDDEYEDEV